MSAGMEVNMKVKVNAGLLAHSLREVTVNGNNAFCLTAMHPGRITMEKYR